jgi:uncharacterized protein (TIGR02996 family)
MHSDRAAFVAAIRAKPDDDGPRLVCADWFEEQGDEANTARAVFIRTQVARARLAPTDPQQRELEARELRLLQQYAKAWSGSHFVFKKSRFRRGFIEYVHLNLQHFLHHRRQMFALEPVRDISLTGWIRAPDELVRRVAACEEWQNIETLRIHHQGPHKSPRSNVATLIESPHLSALTSLRLPMLAIDADARRRLERAPLLTRLSDFTIPYLETYPHDPGAWFGGGSPPAGVQWNSIRLTYYPAATEVLAQLTAARFWSGLRALSFPVPMFRSNEALRLLRDRMPKALESLRLFADNSVEEMSDADSFYARLATQPLRSLRIEGVPVSTESLAEMLGNNSRCELHELTLRQCGLTDEHIAVIAASPGVRHLHRLELSQYQGVTSAAAATLYSSRNFASLVKLRLAIPSFWPAGLDLLATATGWDRLRDLVLSGRGLTPSALTRFLDSANSRCLVRLAIEDGYPGELQISADVVKGLARLPHLARLRLVVQDANDDLLTHLAGLKPRVWPSFRCFDSVEHYTLDPNDLPPLDEDQEDQHQLS